MFLLKVTLFMITILFVLAISNDDNGYCHSEDCSASGKDNNIRLIFYDVNPPEGFNLRRDVYMRFAIFISKGVKQRKDKQWKLVLPPWYRMYHWQTDNSRSKPYFWNMFFDVTSLKTFAPVLELYEIFNENSKPFQIDTLYVLQNYDDPFEGGIFTDKWEINTDEDCDYDGSFWGYNNITTKEVVCVRFQGKISNLWQLINLHPNDRNIMFAHGEIPLHDVYGDKNYWDCRKSMKFSKKLVDRAKTFITEKFNCNSLKCDSYMSVHWRRQDFARGRKDLVPSIKGTIKQIDKNMKKHLPNYKNVFIATDASLNEITKLTNGLQTLGYTPYFYLPNKTDLEDFKDGGIAVIEQIICSHAAYFIGTQESTFSYRIQEEREIIGFDSRTTFNRLCPDTGTCERPSKWTVVS